MPLFRRKPDEELPLPSDYHPVDYTSLPEEEPRRGPSRKVQILIGIVAILAVAAVAAYFLVLKKPGNPEPVAADPTPSITYTLELRKAELAKGPGNTLLASISGSTTNLPPGTIVEARLLENDEPFELWETGVATTTLKPDNTLSWNIPSSSTFSAGSKDAKYLVEARADVEGQVVTATRALKVLSSAQPLFYAGSIASLPTPSPTAGESGATAVPATATTEAAQPTATKAAPTAQAGEATPVPGTARSQGQIYLTPFDLSQERGTLHTNDPVKVVAKFYSGDWYLIAAPTTTGWVRAPLLKLQGDGATLPTTGGPGNKAAVFNGGRIRAVPITGSEVGQVKAGQTVDLLARNADSSWFKIKAPAGTGWVSASLLTIDPKIAAGLPTG